MEMPILSFLRTERVLKHTIDRSSQSYLTSGLPKVAENLWKDHNRKSNCHTGKEAASDEPVGHRLKAKEVLFSPSQRGR